MTRLYGAVTMVACCVLGACATTTPLSDTGDLSPVSSDAAWQRLDSDGDGTLSLQELESQHAVALQEDLEAADSNGDGRVSHAEFDDWWPRMTKTPQPPSLARLNASSAR